MDPLKNFTDMLNADKNVIGDFKKAMIPTSHGYKSIDNLYSDLMYGNYAANRDYGMTHEQLISIGVGNEDMRVRYDNETKTA